MIRLKETQRYKVKIYLDSGADISFFKSYHNDCDFCTFPYDLDHRRKKPPKPRVAFPSEALLDDCHIIWNETDFRFDDFSASPVYGAITSIVGPDNRRDILHLDSAHKEQVDLFLTSDKDDIWSKRNLIEQLVCFKIYHTASEQTETLTAIAKTRSVNQKTTPPKIDN